MVINALNCGAKVFMADFEDSNTPTFDNLVQGQLNLRNAWLRQIDFTNEAGKSYALNDTVATLVVRNRGWHLPERHVLVDGEPVSGSLFDFTMYLTTSGRIAIEKGFGPYFYLPKMESHLEARLWNDVFVAGQEALGIPRGTIRATCLIETIMAAFEMEEILYELREHSSGLNAGRWDYIFSMIKKFRTRGEEFQLPDRSEVKMTVPFMRAYTELLVKSCHSHGAHAIGGMAAFIPNRKDAEVNDAALTAVRADKSREADDGFDGSWVAHPDLVPVALEVFDAKLGDAAEPARAPPRGRAGHRRPAARRQGHARARSPRPASATTSASASSTSSRGCAAAAPSRSSTSWRTPRRPRSAARRSGSGSTTA